MQRFDGVNALSMVDELENVPAEARQKIREMLLNAPLPFISRKELEDQFNVVQQLMSLIRQDPGSIAHSHSTLDFAA